MDVFEAKLRGFHAKAIQNIMARTTGFNKPQIKEKCMKPKGDNITTYLRKFQIDKENLNLAKRILLCESEHNHKFYQRQWKKTQNFLRVRSNFKRSLCNQEPRIFKFQPIMGYGSCFITITFTRFQSSPIHFRSQNLYQLKALVKHNARSPTNSHFSLNTLGTCPMSFYIPNNMKKKKITCKISQIKQNQIYEKGKFQINLLNQQQQNLQLINKQGKIIALLGIKINKQVKQKKYIQNKQNLNTSVCNDENNKSIQETQLGNNQNNH